MCMSMWLCVMCMPYTWRGPEDLLEMELQGVWSICFGFWELNLGLFARALKAFNHWPMSLAQLFAKQSQCSQCCLFYFSIYFLICYLLLSSGMCYSTHWKSEDNCCIGFLLPSCGLGEWIQVTRFGDIWLTGQGGSLQPAPGYAKDPRMWPWLRKNSCLYEG